MIRKKLQVIQHGLFAMKNWFFFAWQIMKHFLVLYITFFFKGGGLGLAATIKTVDVLFHLPLASTTKPSTRRISSSGPSSIYKFFIVWRNKFIHSFIHSFIHPFINSFIYSFILSSNNSYPQLSKNHLLVHSCIHPYILLLFTNVPLVT